MRKLTPEECEFIAGGEQMLDSYYDEGGEIVVTGSPPPYSPPYYPPPPPPYTPPYYPPYGGGGGGGETPPPPPADEDVIEVDFGNGLTEADLTPAQKEAYDDFLESIATVDEWIKNLPDDAVIVIEDGYEITGAELKEAWAKTDFIINPAGYDGYENGSARGEADYNGGNPIVSINIDIIDGYNDHNTADGNVGTDFLVLHELAHLTTDQVNGQATMSSERHEQIANDIARAIAVHYEGNSHVLVGQDYSDTPPSLYISPPPSPPPYYPPGYEIP